MNKVELMQKLLQEAQNMKYGVGNVTAVIDKAKMYIKKCFGETSEYIKRVDSIVFNPIIFTTETPDYIFAKSFNRGKEELVSLIKTMIEDIELSQADIAHEENNDKVAQKIESKSRNVFVVHGHDEHIRVEVEAFLRCIGYEPIVLFKEPNKGQTIIEKIEASAKDVCYSIVLYTPCDMGRDKNASEDKPRARQNVVFEHGYMCAKLGRQRVCALCLNGVEIPGDLSGIVYTPCDPSGAWKYAIARDMKAIGLSVDMNTI